MNPSARSITKTLRLTPLPFIALTQILPTVAVCFASFSTHAYAADAQADAGSADNAQAPSTLPAVKVQATRQQLPGDLLPPNAGGQTASGAQVGVLGKQKLIDVPFSVTSYTSQLIEDQQAHTIADVVAKEGLNNSFSG